MLEQFSENDKTFILLSGGEHQDLVNLIRFFDTDENFYPWHYFTEPGLNNAVTAICIVIPELLYDEKSTNLGRKLLADSEGKLQEKLDIAQYQDEGRPFTSWELEFLKKRVVCRLAD
jgi:hypothetical protein